VTACASDSMFYPLTLYTLQIVIMMMIIIVHSALTLAQCVEEHVAVVNARLNDASFSVL